MEKLVNGEDEVYDYVNSLSKGSILYDLGACIGGFALHALEKDLKVICFEVDKENYEGLLENYDKIKHKLNKNHYFKPFQIGISNRKGTAILRIGQPEKGGHHKTLKSILYSASENIIGHIRREVNIDTLDNIIKENHLPYPEYMKIDIDGSELAFVLGAQESLKHCKSLIIELQTDNEFYPKIHENLLNLGFKETFRSTQNLGVPHLHNIIYSK